MNLTEIAQLRLTSQLITATKVKTPADVVAWMGAIQAQDFPMSKWAVGVRLSGSTEKSVVAALDSGEILRTHVLRPTWHLVAAADIYWMLELTAPQIMTHSVSRHRDLGLSPDVISKSETVILKALQGGTHLTREELVGELKQAQISTNENRSSHLLAQAELDRLICSGASINGKPTYALLEERVPKPSLPGRDEALSMLASRYFSSHGPATLNDFTWWSGLKISDARRGFEMIKSGLNSENVDGQTYWFAGPPAHPESPSASVVLLPAFDEFIISYTDRHAVLPEEKFSRMVSANGIFRPVILENGRVIGIWKRTVKKDRLILETEFIDRPSTAGMDLLEKEFVRFGQFLEKKAEYNPAGRIEPLKSKAGEATNAD